MNKEILDTSLLEEYYMSLGASVVKEMLALYQEQVVGYLAEISEAGQTGEHDDWQKACHKMKGAAGSVGLIALNKALASAEKDTSDYQVQHQNLAELNQESLTEFAKWVDLR